MFSWPRQGIRTLHFVVRAERLGRARDGQPVVHPEGTVVVVQNLLNLPGLVVLPKLVHVLCWMGSFPAMIWRSPRDIHSNPITAVLQQKIIKTL